MAISFSDKRILTGARTVLIPVTEHDADELYPLLRDPEVSVLTGSVPSSRPTEAELQPYSLAELRDIYGRWAVAGDRIVWTIRDPDDSRTLGEAVLNDLDATNLSCGFRIWTAGGRGRGIGTEATRMAVDYAFEQGVHRIELEVYDFNPRARHVYEKVGFRHEGTKRDALRFDGGWVDAHLMAILSTDPRP
jgi:RimJ/RimL family protein N-acetyltransferase